MDDLTAQLTQRAVRDPMQALQGAQSIGADVPATNQISGAMPLTPGDMSGLLNPELISQLKNLATVSAPEATAKLINLLTSFKAAKPNPVSILRESQVGSRVPPPLRFGKIFNGMLSRVPEAEGKLTMPIESNASTRTLSRPEGLPTAYKGQLALSNAPKVAPELPRVSSAGELGDIVANPNLGIKSDSLSTPPPSLAADRSGLAAALKNLKRSQFTENDIRAIRSMSKEEAIKAYPWAKPATLSAIKARSMWNAIKD